MTSFTKLIDAVTERLKGLASNNAVVARKISVGDRHVLPLCELAMGFGGAGFQAEATEQSADMGTGKGDMSAAGGMAKAAPVAVIIVNGTDVRIESLGL